MSCGAYADKGLLPSGHRKAPARAQVRHCGSAPVPATGALVKHGSSTQPLPGDSCYCWPVVLSALFSGQAPLHVCQPWPFLSRMAGAQPRCGWWRKPGLSPNPQCLLPPNTLINCLYVQALLPALKALLHALFYLLVGQFVDGAASASSWTGCRLFAVLRPTAIVQFLQIFFIKRYELSSHFVIEHQGVGHSLGILFNPLLGRDAAVFVSAPL